MDTNSRSVKIQFPRILKGVNFYLTRLKRAPLAELSYRLGQAGTHFRARRLVGRKQIPCLIPSIELLDVRSLDMPDFYGQVERAVVDRILAGFHFNLNADPDAVTSFELELRNRVCPSIQEISGNVDIRAVWEAARLQHVTVLLAWLRQQPDDPLNVRVKEFARSEIIGWLIENPFLYGPHYLSAMECGLRLPVFFYALKVLDNLNSSDSGQILKALFLHAWWIERNLSLFSSLGNHTVCEATGLVIAGGIFRATEEGRRWLNTGVELLAQELPHQVHIDGGPAEQAFGYHRFVLDSYLLAVDFLERNKFRRCSDFKERLLVGEVFLSTFSYMNGIIPAVGDYDDGHTIAPGLYPYRPPTVQQHLPCRTFSQSGYTVIKGADGTLLTLDHGPLGMAPLYGHGHADALSVTLSVAGTPFLVDCGTYRYGGAPALRRYFKGTKAHSTVCIDGVDQATQLTGFVWDGAFSGYLKRTIEASNSLLLEASHDGYSRLDVPVCHIRSILHDPDGSWVIKDRFQGSGRHNFELNFHFHPEVSLTELGSGWLAERNGLRLQIELLHGRFLLCLGEEEPPLGWFSPAYNVRLPSPVLQVNRFGASEEIVFETRITVK